jgi:hypothetical protein
MAAITGRDGSPRMCEICGDPARGSSYDRQWGRLHWYCRAHHPMMPGGVDPVTGPASRGRVEYVPARPLGRP